MKKRLLSVFLALCMVLTLTPAAAFAGEPGDTNAAKVGDQEYATLAEAIDDAKNGQTVTLLSDVAIRAEGVNIKDDKSLKPQIQFEGKNITLDMAGKKISYVAPGEEKWIGTPAMIAVGEGANLTITGNGTIDTEAGNNNAYGIDLKGGNVTIENGIFTGATTAAQVETGTLTINGGTFKQAKTVSSYPEFAKYVINAIDANWKNQTAKIAIKGGIFCFDPAANPEGDGTTYVAEGFVSRTNGDGTYTVGTLNDVAVAQIGDTKYVTLDAAVNAVKSGDTVKLLKDILTNQIVTIPADTVITLELNGKTLTVQTSRDALDNFGTLTVQDSVGGGKIVSTNGDGIYAESNSTTTINSGTIESVEGAVCTGTSTGATITIEGGTFTASDNAVIAGNGSNRSEDANKITINDGIFNGGIKTTGYIACGIYAPWKDEITVNGGTFNIAGGAGIVARAGNVTVSGGTFNVTGNAKGWVGDQKNSLPCAALVFDQDANYPGMDKDSKITVEGGQFASEADAIATVGDDSVKRISISGGYFTSDPSAYLVEGKVAVESNESGYNYMVADKNKVNPAEVVTASPNVADPNLPDGATEAEKGLATSVKEALTSTGEGATKPNIEESALSAAANVVANNNRLNSNDASVTKALADAKVNTTGKSVTIVIQPYMDIAITDVAINDNSQTVTLEITPMYRTVATTATDLNAENAIKLEGDDQNAAQIGDPQKLDITKPVIVTIPLSTDFAGEDVKTLYVNHEKNGRTYVYTGSVTSDVLTFTNPHGFSKFTITSDGPAAQIGDVGYASLEDAVNDAKDGETVTILKGGLSANMTGNTRTITLQNGTDESLTVTINGQDITLNEKDDTKDFTYTRPSSGGGSSSGSSSDITVDNSKNGTVTVSPKNASKGDTVTITVKPDTGYELDELTVTDKNGDVVKLTDAGDGKYTFTMPASKVTVDATFAAVTVKPENPFIDVEENAYYYDPVLWAVENGITSGTSATTFSPNASCTRAQMVTFLWRANGSPKAAGANPFTDVKSDAYYYDAVLWAVEKGITKGVSETAFDPDATVTRSQTVTFLHRANGSPAASGSNPFTDVATDAYYTAAVQWAVAEGVTSGTSATTFAPNSDCTRGQIVTFMYRDAQ